jgi:hypothetical protein
MTVSRIRPALLAAAMLGFGGAALAQSETRVLIPGVQADPPAAAEVPRDGIRARPLDAPGAAAAGLLSEEEGGLPATLWQGSDRDTVVTLIRRLPAHTRSGAARSLARKLLLSAGDMAPGRAADADVLALRLDALLTLGEAGSVVALMDAAGPSPSPGIAEPLVEALFVLDETDRACDVVAGQVRAGGAGYWQQASVFCDLRAGRRQEAELTRALLNETGAPPVLFQDLADALQDGVKLTVRPTGDMKALHAAMLREAGSAGVKDIDEAPPHLAPMLASASRLSPAERIAAGERGVRYRTMAPALIMVLFGSGNADRSVSPYREPVAAAMTSQGASVRAEALVELWRRAESEGEHAVAARYAEQFLRRIQPEASLAFAAPAALRMTLLNGDVEQAGRWLAVLRRSAAAGDADAAAALAAAQPLAHVAGIAAADGRLLRAWWESLAEDADRTASALTVLMVLDALGAPAGETIWSELLADGAAAAEPVPGDPALWRQLVMAGGGGRIGETALAALVTVGEDGPGSLDAVTLSTVVGSLRRIGETDAARLLAVEALIAQGD